MAVARKMLIDPNEALYYHVSSRVVRQAYLCGEDTVSGKNYDHRKSWLIARIKRMSQIFGIDVQTYAIMDNHFHMVVYFDPKRTNDWSDLEIVRRWCAITPPKSRKGSSVREEFDKKVSETLKSTVRVKKCREQISSISWFMYHIKHPLSRLANKEDGTHGCFFDDRFYSGALLDEEAVISCMAYVDLNPVRAKISKAIEEYQFTGVAARLEKVRFDSDQLDEYLNPLYGKHDLQSEHKVEEKNHDQSDSSQNTSDSQVELIGKSQDNCNFASAINSSCIGIEPTDTMQLDTKQDPPIGLSFINDPPIPIRITLAEYLNILDSYICAEIDDSSASSQNWNERIQSMTERRPVYGAQQLVDDWATRQTWPNTRWRTQP